MNHKRHRIYPMQWRLAEDALRAVLSEGQGADHWLQAAFRERRQMGARDRGVVSDLVYGVLRDLRRLQAVAGHDAPAALCAVHALERDDAIELERYGIADADTLRERTLAARGQVFASAVTGNVPDAIDAAFQAQFGAEAAAALERALQQQAPVDLRVNRLRRDRGEVQAALHEAGIEAEPTPFAPFGLRLAHRAALHALAAYRDGWFEPQDEGSQLLARLVGAVPGSCVVDYCAGAGGKALALAADMDDRGTLWAFDSEPGRLRRLEPRARRAGVHCIRSAELGADGLPPPGIGAPRAGEADAVLVDAPCSGTGTWRRQPEARLRPLDLDALTTLQAAILERAAVLLRPGGRLVYATCSLLDVENRGVVEAFVERHPEFAPVDAGAVLAAQGIDLPGACLQLRPDLHGTDGFFGAVLQRAD